MADTVTVRKIFDGIRTCEYEFTNLSDSTGEAAVQKIDISTLIGSDGSTASTGERPQSLVIIKADWEVIGFPSVSLLWDRTSADEVAILMNDTGRTDYERSGGKVEANTAAAGTGDILITTNGTATAGDTYRIKVLFRKKYA